MKKRACSVLMAGMMVFALMLGVATDVKAAGCCGAPELSVTYRTEEDCLYSHKVYCSTHQKYEACAVLEINTYKVTTCGNCGHQSSILYTTRTIHRQMH